MVPEALKHASSQLDEAERTRDFTARTKILERAMNQVCFAAHAITARQTIGRYVPPHLVEEAQRYADEIERLTTRAKNLGCS